MMKVLMLYANDLFDADLEEKPIAGTQTAFIELSRALAQSGCMVYVHTDTLKTLDMPTRKWDQLSHLDDSITYDLMIVNVSPYLLGKFRHIKARKKVLWIHNHAKYLLYWNRLKFVVRHLPVVVFSGSYHKSTLPFFIPTGGRKIIEYGISDNVFAVPPENEIGDKKRIYFTSNPLRSLRWLVDIWVEHIHGQFPHAELHVFSGWKTYGAWGIAVQRRMQQEIDYAIQFTNKGIFIRDVLPKHLLFEEMRSGYAMFYKGDAAETFCLSVAEAQALGLPAVVCDLGSMKERVEHAETGFVAKNDREFIANALKLLGNNQLQQEMSKNAERKYAHQTWLHTAMHFKALLD